MDGSSMTVSGTLQSGAVDVVSTTTGEAEGEPMLVRLDPGVTFAEASAAVAAHKGDPNYLDPYGAIVFDVYSPQGDQQRPDLAAARRLRCLRHDQQRPGEVVAHRIHRDRSGTAGDVTRTAGHSQRHRVRLPWPEQAEGRRACALRERRLPRAHVIVWVLVKDTKAAEQATALLRAGKKTTQRRGWRRGSERLQVRSPRALFSSSS